MTAPRRLAGSGRWGDRTVVWTMSEGRRGRRWREVVARGSATRHALLLETDPDGRFSHLELARADGLWTFHPEADGTLHGNHVARGEAGVRHVAGWPFGRDDALLIEGSPLAAAALAWRWRAATAGSAWGVAAVEIRADGGLVRHPEIRVGRLDDRRWRVGEGNPFLVDDAGLPVLGDGEQRPLEEA